MLLRSLLCFCPLFLGGIGCDSAPPAAPAAPPAVEAPAAEVPASTPAAAAPHAGVAWTIVPTAEDSVEAVRAAVAATTGVPVVYIGATWCGPCKAYKRHLEDPRMVAAHKGAHIVELDADRHAGAIQALSIQPEGVPHWEMVDRTARPVGRRIDGRSWESDTPENMAGPLTEFFGQQPG